MTDKAWLKEELLRDLMRFNGNPNMTDYELGIASGIRTAINLTEKLDEPEIEENFYTFDNVKKWLQDNGFVVFEKDKLDEEVQQMVDETYEATNEKPVIPQFVADWLEEAKDRKMTLYGAIHECPREVDYWLVDGDSSNQETFARAWLDGYEVEKEKKYRVTFNLTEWNDEASELEEYSAFLALDVTSDETLFTTSRDGIRDYRTDLTEFEIKAIDERYWAFAEEVVEDD